jgi:hypothetical protein
MKTMAMAVLMAIGVAMGARGDEIFSDARVVARSWDLLKSARYGLGRQEEAAFVVRDADGALSFVVWPSTGEALASHFTGALPPHTVALVHTHPMQQVMPSSDDRATAQRLGLPVYVLARTAVTRTLGGRSEIVLAGDWNPAK